MGWLIVWGCDLIINGIIIKMNKGGFHSAKYYHLVKVLRKHKNQALTQKLKEKNSKQQGHFGQQQELSMQKQFDKDHQKQFDDKDRKITIKLSRISQAQRIQPRLWQLFSKKAKTLNSLNQFQSLQRKIFQRQDEQLITKTLQISQSQKTTKQKQRNQYEQLIRLIQQQITVLKQQMIKLSLQLQSYVKQFVELKSNFDKEQKMVNERSVKYKQQKTKDLMIKNIDKQDTEMRKAMLSKIKLNQQLDLGFQIQRRRAFNQGKQIINEKKKTAQDKQNKLKIKLQQLTSKQLAIIRDKKKIQQQIQSIREEVIFFVKSLIKNFSHHSKGIKWLIDLLINENVEIKQSDFPEKIKKQQATFIAHTLSEAKIHMNSCKTKSKLNMNSVAMLTPKSNIRNRLKTHFKTQTNLFQADDSKLFTARQTKQKAKNTVHFDIERESSLTQYGGIEKGLFNIKSKSLKKIYEGTGVVISRLIMDKTWSHESFKLIPSNHQKIQQQQPILEQKKLIEEKIKQKFTNVRQKERRNYVKALLFGK